MKKTIILLGSVFVLNAHSQSLCFNAAVNYTLGTNPLAILWADFNNDGKKDLATTISNQNKVAISLGNGNGTFGNPTKFSVGSYPNSLTSADFNGDGKVDLAVLNGNSNTMSILLGTGTGSFSAATNSATGISPYGIVSADFNNDGKKDLAVCVAFLTGNGSAQVFLGNGNGTFGSYTNFFVGGPAYGIVAADLNADGKTDLATANYGNNNISVLIGNGTGGFAGAVSYTAGIQPTSIIATDLNADGIVDLATSNIVMNNNLSVFLGTGAGNFANAVNSTIYSGAIPQCLTYADFNADGKVDLAFALGDILIALGNGTGSFTSTPSYTVGSYPTAIIATDLNADGRIDIAAPNNNSNNYSVLINCGAVGFEEFSKNKELIKMYPNPASTELVVEDIDNNFTGEFVIYNVLGEKVATLTLSEDKNRIDLTTLKSGVYYLKYRQTVQKFIKE
jgi:hypothetical protein